MSKSCRTLTRLITLVLMACLVLTLGIVAFAADEEAPTAYFAVPDGATAPEAQIGTTVTMPGAVAYDGYDFVGWTTERVKETTDRPATVYEAGASVEIDTDTVFYALYSKTTEGSETQTTWSWVKSASELSAGDSVVMTSPSGTSFFVAGDISSSVMQKVDATSLPGAGVVFTLGGTTGAWTFANSSGKLLGATAVKKVAWGSGTTTWSISIDASGNATIQNGTSSYGRFLYNASSPRFTTYTSNTSASMLLPRLYKGTTTSSSEETTYTTLGASYAIPYTATFITPGNTSTLKGASVIMPECDVVVDEAWGFVGWATESFDETTDAPEIFEAGAEVALNKDTTFYAVYSKTVEGGVSEKSYVLTDIANITSTDIVVITMTYTDGTVYALTNGNGTGKAPTATIITTSGSAISSEPADVIKWNITNNNGNLTIYPNGTTSTWLYCTSTNDGVRVGTNANKVFTIDASSGYLKNTATSRYVGVYRTNPDWRCYTNTTGNTANQTLGFYVETTVSSTGYIYTTNFEGAVECDHSNVTTNTEKATCTENGSEWDICDSCGVQVGETRVIEATGHNYVNNECTVCGDVKAEAVDYSGRYYIATIRSSGNYFYMTSDLGTASTKRYQAVDSGLTTLPESITSPVAECVFVVEKNDDGTYSIYADINDDVKYLGWESGNSGILVKENDAIKFEVNAKEDGTYNFYFKNSNETRYLSLNGTTNNNYFAFYAGTQRQDLTLIPVAKNCQHTNTEPAVEAKNATCTEDGTTAGLKCSDCSYIVTEPEIIPATGHAWDSGVETKAPTCEEKGETTYTCGTCSETKIEEITMLPHVWVDNECTGCDLVLVGRYYISSIRTEGNYFYMTNDLGTAATKRYQAADTKLTKLPDLILSENAEADKTFVLVKDGENYYMYAEGITAGENYLGMTDDESSGDFVTKENALALTVDEKSDGTYNIHFTASDAERYLALNNDSRYNYFAWYLSGQKQNLILVPVLDETPAPKVYSASLKLGKDLSLLYTVKAPCVVGELAMKFTFGDGEVIVTEYTANYGGKYVFTFSGIGPHQMAELINAEFLVDGVVVASYNGYSVEKNLNGIKEDYPDNAVLAALVDSVLIYGSAAEAYYEANGGEVAYHVSIEGITAADRTPEDTDFDYVNQSQYGFTGAGVYFDVTNKLYVKIYVAEGLNAKVTVNGKEISIADMQSLGGGHYKFYTDAIQATDFDAVYNIAITVDDVAATLTYSVNSYVYEMVTNSNTNEVMRNLAIALYNYGVCAEEYPG